MTVNFTGHSLGGLMASTLALWFYEMLNSPELTGSRERTAIHVYSFGGPTAGDQQFASYSDSILQPPPSSRSCTRYINEADVAANVWHKDDMEKILSFYGKTVPISNILNGLIHCLTGMVKGMGYTQLANKKVIAGYEETLRLEGLEKIDLEAEFDLKEHLSLYNFYKKKHFNNGINEENIPGDIKKTLSWLMMAMYQHVVPYIFKILKDKQEITLILDEIIYPLIEETYQGAEVKDAFKKSVQI